MEKKRILFIGAHTDDADILFVPASHGICKVECFDAEKVNYSVTAVNNTLTIQNSYDIVTWKDFAIQRKMPKVTVYLPEGAYGDLTVRASTASVEIGIYFTFDNMDVKVTTDDRVVDGFYYAAFLKYFKRLLAHPEVLLDPPEEVNKDID